MFDRSFTERYFQADFNNFFFLGNKITVTYKATLNNRKNVMSNSYILYSRLKNNFICNCFQILKSLSVCIIVNNGLDSTVTIQVSSLLCLGRIAGNIFDNANQDQGLLFLQHLNGFPEIRMTRWYVTLNTLLFVRCNSFSVLWNMFQSWIGKVGCRRGAFLRYLPT